MLVYGDRARSEQSRDSLAELADLLDRAAALPSGIVRHAAVVAALIAAGEVVQGVADDGFATVGMDTSSPAVDAAMAVLMRLAACVRQSWTKEFAVRLPLPGADDVKALAPLLPAQLCRRRPEGFAYYALYPEAYLCAAQGLAPAASTCVIGLRSIGTTLGAMVASGLPGATALLTLRPIGHPFRRRVAVAEPSLAASADRFAIVDEGPGLSGSSFGAAIDLLLEHGVPPDRIHLFPGHDGAPGPQATRRHRILWRRVHRHPASFEAMLAGPPGPPRHLASWAADLLGPAEAPLQDISGGAWRALRRDKAEFWPPVHAQQERRKFLYRAGGAVWLLKFVGLGVFGTAQAARARALAEAGFSPEVAGLRHGFLVERWLGDAAPLLLAPPERPAFLRHLGRYLGFRARAFPAPRGDGATMAALWRMACHNVGQALGDAAAGRLAARPPALATFERHSRPVWTDNRHHVWEWLRRADGGFVKTDAIDHGGSHDLIGCQDIAWDIAGAAVEFDFSPGEEAFLRRVVTEFSGSSADPCLIAFMKLCYLAFQVGHFTMAAAASSDAERMRLDAVAAAYQIKLAQATSHGFGVLG